MSAENKRNNGIIMMIGGMVLALIGAILLTTGIGCCFGLPLAFAGSLIIVIGIITARKAKYEIKYAQGLAAGQAIQSKSYINGANKPDYSKIVLNRSGMWKYSINGIASDFMSWGQLLEEIQKIGDTTHIYLWTEGMDRWESANSLIYKD